MSSFRVSPRSPHNHNHNQHQHAHTTEAKYTPAYTAAGLPPPPANATAAALAADRPSPAQLRACIIAGLGFLTAAYDLFVINHVLLLLGYIYYANEFNIVPLLTDAMVKLAGIVGIMFGQLLFGFLADRLGRRRIYAVEMAVVIVATIASCFSANAVRGINVFSMLAVWRVILGIGIGADTPLSATIASEFANTARRGAILALIFSTQGIGILAAAGVSLLTMLMFRGALEDDPFLLDYVWRIIIAVGLIPALASLYFRLSIPETPRYLREVQLAATRRGLAANTTASAVGPVSTLREFMRYFALPARAKVLICTCIASFCADLAFYGANLNSAIILRTVGVAHRGSPYDEIQRNALGQLVLVGLGILPGYYIAASLVDRLGRRVLQMIGFGVLIVIYAGMAVAYWWILFYSIEAFVVIFAVSQLFLTLGPVTTVFIIPAEVFPTRFRATACGLVAAVGKLGAILAQFGFAQFKDIGGPDVFFDRLLYVFAGVMLIGLLATIGIPETKGLPLEQLEEQMDHAGRPAAAAKSADATLHNNDHHLHKGDSNTHDRHGRGHNHHHHHHGAHRHV